MTFQICYEFEFTPSYRVIHASYYTLFN